MFSRLIHIIACTRTSCLFVAEWNIPCLEVPYFVYWSSVLGHLSYFHLLVMLNNIATDIPVQVFLWTSIFSLGYCPRSGIAWSYGNFMLNLLRNHPPRCFQKWLYGFTFPPVMYEVQVLVLITISCFLAVVFIIAILMSMKEYPTAVSVHIYPMTNDVEHLFVDLLPICTSSLEKCVFKSLAHFFIGLFVILSLSYKNVYISWIWDPFKKCDLEILFLMCELSW